MDQNTRQTCSTRHHVPFPGLIVSFVTVAIGLAVVAASLPAPFGVNWSASYGWTGRTAVNELKDGTLVGQPIVLEKAILSYIGLRFATYSGQPSGTVELMILKNDDPPRSFDDMNKRMIWSRKIDAYLIKDNESLISEVSYLPFLPVRQVYLIVHFIPSKGSTPLTLWADNDRSWPGRHAELLKIDDELQEVRPSPIGSHLTLEMGGDKATNLFMAIAKAEGVMMSAIGVTALGAFIISPLWMPLVFRRIRRIRMDISRAATI